jgi:proteasome lid subunit RPN8/RPN11
VPAVHAPEPPPSAKTGLEPDLAVRPPYPSGGALSIGRAILSAIVRHAEAAYPEEACGILVGRFATGAGGERAGARVERAVPAENVHEDRRRRFAIAPEVLLAAQKAARAEGLDLVGYSHSHPDHPAEPSETDRADAWPGVSYLIVPVAAGAAGEARSWRLAPETGVFGEERVVVEG